jgi:hypothetical protein
MPEIKLGPYDRVQHQEFALLHMCNSCKCELVIIETLGPHKDDIDSRYACPNPECDNHAPEDDDSGYSVG